MEKVEARDVRRLSKRLVGALLVVGGIAAVVLSPMALDAAAGSLGVDWARLSEVGQSYGAASALLAAIALCVVAYSAWLQVRQTQVSQLQSARTLQLELLRMAIERPEYRSVLGDDLLRLDAQRWREHIYMNLWIMYLQMAFITGALDEEGVRRILAGELFNGTAGIEYWPLARPAFQAEAASRRHQRFVRLVDEEHAKATATRALSRDVGASEQPRHKASRAVKVIVGAGLAAVMLRSASRLRQGRG